MCDDTYYTAYTQSQPLHGLLHKTRWELGVWRPGKAGPCLCDPEMCWDMRTKCGGSESSDVCVRATAAVGSQFSRQDAAVLQGSAVTPVAAFILGAQSRIGPQPQHTAGRLIVICKMVDFPLPARLG